MKYLKLLGIFVIVVAAIFGILQLTNSIDTGGSGILSASSAKGLSDMIKNDWAELAQWDKAKYDEHKGKIKRNLNSNTISKLEAEQLTQQLMETILAKVDGIMSKEYEGPLCNVKVLKQNMEAVKQLQEDNPDLKADIRMKRLEDCYSTYTKIAGFVSKNFSHDVELTKAATSHEHTWFDFNDYAKSQKSLAETYRKNKTYNTYLQGITLLSTGLSNVDNTIDAAKKSYCRQLATSLIGYYKGLDASDKNENASMSFSRDYMNYRKQFADVNSDAESLLKEALRDF